MSMTGERPDPDTLLARAREEEARKSRGRLKLFFGVDVVVGSVETHGRAETEALLDGLEVLPPRLEPYKGTTLREFDLDAALVRHPSVMIVDELAHSNATGSRHAKRWQDVMELLDVGINVYTALN